MYFDKDKIKEALTLENIYSILEKLGGDPVYENFGIISRTICHNEYGEGTRKLYYYENSHLFKCYTECDAVFDIFALIKKAVKIQFDKDYNLYDSILYVLRETHIEDVDFIKEDDDIERLEDWKILEKTEKIQHLEPNNKLIELKTYDEDILNKLNYPIITPWENEGITREVIKHNKIGFYPGNDQITIPHYDMNARFIGLRGRFLVEEDANLYGKYRPLYINNLLYSHPLGLNLYNLNNSAKNISCAKTAYLFESEKSCLLFQSYFGIENDLSVACCGFNITDYQINLLLKLGVNYLLVCFDKQYQNIGDKEYIKLIEKLKLIDEKYRSILRIGFVFDKYNEFLLYKESPIDRGKERFLQLVNEKVILGDKNEI